MRVRKIGVILAGSVVAALALQGCSSGSNSTPSSGAQSWKGQTLHVYWQDRSSRVAPGEQNTWFDQISAKFKKLTGANVAFDTWATPDDELTKIQTSITAGQGPDLYELGSSTVPTAYATGGFVTLTDKDFDEIGGRDSIVPKMLEMSGPDAKHDVSIPHSSAPLAMAYNTKLFAAAGLKKPATTWDGLLSQAKKLTHGGTYGLALAYADSKDPWKFIWGMSIQSGNPLVSGSKVDLTDDAVVNAYKTYFGWLSDQHVVNPAAVGWTATQSLADFAAGKSAILLMTGGRAAATLDKSAVAGNYKFALMPTVAPGGSSNPPGGKPAASIVSGNYLAIPKYTHLSGLALQFIKLLMSKSEQISFYKLFGELPANTSAAKSVAESDPSTAPLVAAASQSWPTPFTGAWGDIQQALMNVVVQSLPALSSPGGVSESSLRSALQKAQQTSQASLDRAKKAE